MMSYKECFIGTFLLLLFYTKSYQAHVLSRNLRSDQQQLSTKNRQSETTIPRNLKRFSGGDHTIIDLSKDFDEATGFNSNEGAKKLIYLATREAHIRGFTVLVHGQKVAEYTRIDLNARTVSPVWSVTKSWTSLIIGMIIEEGKLSIDETLEDIWPNDNIWKQVIDARMKKKVTIESLLTMTSALTDNPIQAARFGSNSGNKIVEALNFAGFLGRREVGKFHYFATGNIFGYVIKERTGLSPDEYAEKYLMPRLGINKKNYVWHRSSDNVAYTYIGLEMTTHQLAKLGQLYVQGGLVDETNRLISQEWIENTFEAHPTGLSGSYGYLWWIHKDWPGKPVCAQGFGGQFVCAWPEKDMVMSLLTDYGGFDFGPHVSVLLKTAGELWSGYSKKKAKRNKIASELLSDNSKKKAKKKKKKAKKKKIASELWPDDDSEKKAIKKKKKAKKKKKKAKKKKREQKRRLTNTTTSSTIRKMSNNNDNNNDDNNKNNNSNTLSLSTAAASSAEVISTTITEIPTSKTSELSMQTQTTPLASSSSPIKDDFQRELQQFRDYEAMRKVMWDGTFDFEQITAEADTAAAAEAAETNNSWSRCTSRATVIISLAFLSMNVINFS